MRIPSLVVPLFLFGSVTQVVAKDIHECSVVLATYASVKTLANEGYVPKERLLGKFEVDNIHEGVRKSAQYAVKGTGLNVFLRIGYDDDLS